MGTSRASNEVSPEARQAVLQRAGYRCERCKADAPRRHVLWCGLDVHHIQQWSVYRDSRPENLLALCVDCHLDWPKGGPVSVAQWLLSGSDREGQVARYIKRGPRNGPRYTRTVSVILKADERQMLTELAQRRELPRAVVLRQLVREAFRRLPR